MRREGADAADIAKVAVVAPAAGVLARLRVEVARGQLVALADPQHPLDTGQHLQRLLHPVGDRHADHADDGVLLPAREVDLQARALDVGDDVGMAGPEGQWRTAVSTASASSDWPP